MAPVLTSWQDVAAERRQAILAKIPSQWLLPDVAVSETSPVQVINRYGLLTKAEIKITEARAIDLVDAMRKRQITSVEVTSAFCKRAAIAHQLTNCLADILFEEALSRAAELDAYMHKHGRPVGPLHGLPISVKEHIYLEGTTATSGLIKWANEMSPEDALIVKTFRDQGAVFHVKTTNPQTLMSLETVSNLFGRTLNPHNINLTPGGSSGGESALLAMRGSPLGIGTDIGGSIRVPAGFCGIYGFKPSVGRTPHGGLSGLHQGMQNVIGVVGPMANSLEDVELFMAAALYQEPWHVEPAVIEKPWSMVHRTPERLRIGILWDDGMVFPHPPVTRALQEVGDALKAAGHIVVSWAPDLHRELYELVNQAYFLDGGAAYVSEIKSGGEEVVSILDALLTMNGTRRSLEESWKINHEIDCLRTRYAQRWNAAKLDCIICPVGPSVASVHDETLHWGYSCVWNALDYSVSTIPVSHVRTSDTYEHFPHPSASHGPSDDWYRSLYETAGGPRRYENAPIAVQIVGRRLEDEKVLQMTRRVIQAVQASTGLPAQSSNSTVSSPSLSHVMHASAFDNTLRIQSAL